MVPALPAGAGARAKRRDRPFRRPRFRIPAHLARETHQTVAAFREKTGYSFPMGLDPSQTVYDRYASNYIPRNFVIDRNGKVVLASVGYDPEEFDEMIKTIEKTLE